MPVTSTRPFEPHQYQIDAITHLLEHPYAGLFLNPGLGKTAITLQAFRVLWMNNAATKMLVLAPLRVIYNVWPAERDKWQNFNGLTMSILHGPKKDEAVAKEADIYLCNPEGMKWLATTNLWKRVDMLVVDESSMWRTHNTARFRLIKPHLKRFRRRVILTGTPVPNGIMQLWAQMFLVDQGMRLEKFITKFRRKYFYERRQATHSEWDLMPGAYDQIKDRISDVVMHRSNDVLDLPELVYTNEEVTLPPSVLTEYRSLKNDFVAVIGEKGVAAFTSAAAAMKLKQLASGGIYIDDDKGEWVHDAKVEALKEIVLESQGQPVLVFYQFRHELERLRKEFDAPYLGGGVSAKESRQIIKDWNNDEIPVLLLHPAAGGHGLNLQDGSCRTLVWFNPPWDLEHYQQATARVWRQGQTGTVVCHHLVAKGTLDEAVVRALRRKENVQDALLEGLMG